MEASVMANVQVTIAFHHFGSRSKIIGIDGRQFIGAARQFPHDSQLGLHPFAGCHQIIGLGYNKRGYHHDRIIGLYPIHDRFMVGIRFVEKRDKAAGVSDDHLSPNPFMYSSTCLPHRSSPEKIPGRGLGRATASWIAWRITSASEHERCRARRSTSRFNDSGK